MFRESASNFNKLTSILTKGTLSVVNGIVDTAAIIETIYKSCEYFSCSLRSEFKANTQIYLHISGVNNTHNYPSIRIDGIEETLPHGVLFYRFVTFKLIKSMIKVSKKTIKYEQIY